MNDVGKTILVVAAHADDEILGCGGSLARWSQEGRKVHILLMTDGEGARTNLVPVEDMAKRITARKSAAEAAAAIIGAASLTICEFPDNRMDGVDLLDVVQTIEGKIAAVLPTCVLTHHAGDVNIDHRVVHDAVLAASRPQPGHSVKTLLFFEVASSTEWRPPGTANNFAPNVFVDISAMLTRKVQALHAYQDELRDFPHPRSVKAIEALARWRGATCGIAAAEAFVLGRQFI